MKRFVLLITIVHSFLNYKKKDILTEAFVNLVYTLNAKQHSLGNQLKWGW